MDKQRERGGKGEDEGNDEGSGEEGKQRSWNAKGRKGR